MTKASTTNETTNWTKMAIDYGPVLAFALCFFVVQKMWHYTPDQSLITATGVLVIASVIALMAAFIIEKRLAWIPLIAALFAVFFGGLTLYFHDVRFIKMKLTAYCACMGLFLIGGEMLKKQPLKALLGSGLPLKSSAWPRFTYATGGFFAALAVVNEVVWRTQSDAVWVIFKASLFFVILGFFVVMMALFYKELELPEEKATDNQ